MILTLRTITVASWPHVQNSGQLAATVLACVLLSLCRTALMLGCEYGCKDAVEVLLKNGADVTLVDALGHDCFYYARIGDSAEILSLIKSAFEESSKGTSAFLMFSAEMSSSLMILPSPGRFCPSDKIRWKRLPFSPCVYCQKFQGFFFPQLLPSSFGSAFVLRSPKPPKCFPPPPRSLSDENSCNLGG